MNNISSINDCFGCGVCAISCPKHIIDIKLNSDGFYEPSISNEQQCINCGLCIKNCAFINKEQSECSNIDGFATWSNDNAIRKKCSSGGIGFEIGKLLIEQEYKVCGVRYNADKERAEHYIANTLEELVQSTGSKYIQSYPTDGLSLINKKEKYLLTGTPCQIASLRRWAKRMKIEANFVFLDFFCHGVPSMYVWKKYIINAKKKVGKITYAAWRHKATGWHDSWAISLDGKEHGEKVNWHDSYNFLIKERKSFLFSRLSQGDMFFKFFLGDCCLGKACYKDCRFKYDNSEADLRIGDLWGQTYKDNEDGVSGLLVFTDKGSDIVGKLIDRCTFIPYPIEVVAEGQMKKNPSIPMFLHKCVIRGLKSNDSLKKTYYKWVYPYKLYTRVINKIKKIFA
jgi:ferredoxin